MYIMCNRCSDEGTYIVNLGDSVPKEVDFSETELNSCRLVVSGELLHGIAT